MISLKTTTNYIGTGLILASFILVGCGKENTTARNSVVPQTNPIANPVPVPTPLPVPNPVPTPVPTPGPIPVPTIPGGLPTGADSSLTAVFNAVGCTTGYLQPTTFFRANGSVTGQIFNFNSVQGPTGPYQLDQSGSIGGVVGNPYVGKSAYRDIIVVRKHGDPINITGYSIQIFLCAQDTNGGTNNFGQPVGDGIINDVDVISPGRVVDALTVQQLYFGNSFSLVVNEITAATVYIGLSANSVYPQTQSLFQNTFYRINM